MESQEIQKNEIENIDKEAILTSALGDLSNKILYDDKDQERHKPQKKGFSKIKPITKMMLEESEFRWGMKLKDDAIKLETKLREEIDEKKIITEEEKDNIVWEVVNFVKQEKAKNDVLEKIAEKINKGEEVDEEEIKEIIEGSEDKKYLKTEDILKQTNFIKEAKKSIGAMHPDTKKSLIKYILSGKDVLKLTEFFEEYTIQKQVDKVVREKQSEKEQKPEEKEKNALMEIGNFFLKTKRTDLGYIKKIAENENLPLKEFKERAVQLTNLLNQPHTNPEKLDKIVENILYREEKRAEEEKNLKMEYLGKVAKRYKEINNFEIAQLANEYKIPLAVVKNEAHALIKKINESKKRGEDKKSNEIIQELIDEQRN